MASNVNKEQERYAKAVEDELNKHSKFRMKCWFGLDGKLWCGFAPTLLGEIQWPPKK